MDPELFDRTLESKIEKMEKWIGRLNKELTFLRAVVDLKSTSNHQRPRPHADTSRKIVAMQTDLFGG